MRSGKFIRGLLAVMSLFVALNACAQTGKLIVVYPRPETETDYRNELPFAMLNLALNKAGVAFELRPSEQHMQQNRALLQLASNVEINVVWSMTSKERERGLLPVRIPIDKGLLGWRILLIRKSDVERFSHIQTIEQLRPLSAGQGHDWPDADILMANEIRVLKSPDYDSLFKMLERNRFDFFPRSVSEAWNELDTHKEKDIEVEKTIALHYPAAEYFFVNQHNENLARLLETGLRKAIKDGSFDRLFNRFNGAAIKNADLKNRHIIKLNNPLMSEDTPFSNRELWFDPMQF
ncbi:ABC-type amino acid transport substrate-binding protein [Oxalobacteraceae bacterium GrIS 2.11]